MRFTVSFDGEEYPFEVDSEMELENLWAFLDVPPPRQQLTFGTIKLAEPKRSLQSYGIHEGATIILRDTGRSSVGGSSAAGGATAAPAVGETHHGLSSDELEDIRRIYDHILNNERVRSQLSGRFPQLVDAAFRGFDTFVPVFRRVWHEFNGMHLQHMVEHARIKENPYDVEAQRKIEEMIRLENIQRNLQEALENNPESFASVTMLYIVMEINGIRAKTFVDSGAQTTIMTPKLAERFGITRLIDERYKGIARGVGVSQIVGRVHSVQIKLGSQFLTCSFTIIE
ncbi:DNA damage-inducible protein 1, partial [Spiromyces aspiralis]